MILTNEKTKKVIIKFVANSCANYHNSFSTGPEYQILIDTCEGPKSNLVYFEQIYVIVRVI